MISNKAIQTLNKNILVSASAGAGKTKLLIDRLIKRIMIDRVEVSNILALTFTEAAASEMKHRLQLEITNQLSMKDDSFLKRQLSLIEISSISTIHSFCLSVVKDYGYVINLDPKVTNNLLDDATRSLLIKKCLDQVINQAIEAKDESFFTLVQTLCPRSENLTPLKNAILNVVHVRNAKVDPDLWDEEVLHLYDAVGSMRELPNYVLTLLQEDYLIQIKKLENTIVEIQETCAFVLEDDIEAWETIAMALKEIPQMIHEAVFDKANQQVQAIATIKTKSIGDHENYKRLRDQYNKIIKKLVEEQIHEKDLLYDLASQQPLVQWLLVLAKNMMNAYVSEKHTKKVMDFDDMEKFALAILSDSRFNVDTVYQTIFSDVLVDEFQDTNDIQHAIISKVSRKDNVFRVGDIKQSIYRFRNAKPQLMRDLIQEKDSNDLVLNLPNNFRSCESIVSFNNFVFSKLMNIPTFDDEYKENDHVLIGLERQKEPSVPVECDVIDSTLEEDTFLEASDDEVALEETTKEGQLKARHIAKRITLFKEMGYDFKDMCILVRTHRIKPFLKDIFDEVNIPYFIDSKSGFFFSQPVQDVLGYLRYLANQHDLISLTGLLSSGFFQVSFNELAEARLLQKEKNISLHDAYKSMFPTQMEELEQTRIATKNSKLSEILIQIYQKNDFYMDQCNEQAKINLDYLIEKAVLYEQKNEHGITRFLATVENLQDEVSSEAIPIGRDDDVVKVMTVHQSKGLQFPIVFFWTNNVNKNLDVMDTIIVDPILGIGMHTIELPYRFRRRNLLRTAIEFNSIKQDLQEQIRLLYVALTRAESRMIIVATKSKENLNMPIDQYLIYHQKGTAHWLTSIFEQFNRPFMTMNFYKPVDSLPFYPEIEKKALEITKGIQVLTAKPTQKTSTFVPVLNFEQSLKAAELGSIIHDALSTLIINNWDIQSLDSLEDLSTSQHSQIEQFINHPFTKSIQSFPMESEYPLLMHYQDTYQQGYIDLLVVASDKNIIIDFKSDIVRAESELVSRHQDQLFGYVYAIEKVYPKKPVEAYVYSLHLNTYVKIH